MITPSQIKEKTLSTAAHGYDIDETNAFISEIEESFSAIYDENKELYRKMEILAAKIEEYRAEEESIKDTLLTAQKAAGKVEREAKERADKLLADSAKTVQGTVMDAKEKAEKIVSEAREYVAGLTKEKSEAAQQILADAQQKAQKELADAKADAAALLTEAKSISAELIEKAKSEKEYYDNLTSSLRSEAERFKASLVELYNAQLEKLGDMMEAPAAAEKAQAEQKIEEADKNIEAVSARIDEIEQELDEPQNEPQEPPAADDGWEDISSGAQQDEPAEPEQSGVEYELSEVSESEEDGEPEEEPDVHDAIDAFSQGDDTQETAGAAQEEGHLPFEDFFHVKAEESRTTEKISLIPPDDDEDDEGAGFKGFFRNKKKKK